jgi:hypothetical protein
VSSERDYICISDPPSNPGIHCHRYLAARLPTIQLSEKVSEEGNTTFPNSARVLSTFIAIPYQRIQGHMNSGEADNYAPHFDSIEDAIAAFSSICMTQ